MASKRRPGSAAGRAKQASAARARPRADSSPDSLESEPRPYRRAQPAHQAGLGRAEHGGARPGKQSRAEVKGLARTGTGLITDFSRALDDSLHRPEVRMASARAARLCRWVASAFIPGRDAAHACQGHGIMHAWLLSAQPHVARMTRQAARRGVHA